MYALWQEFQTLYNKVPDSPPYADLGKEEQDGFPLAFQQVKAVKRKPLNPHSHSEHYKLLAL